MLNANVQTLLAQLVAMLQAGNVVAAPAPVTRSRKAGAALVPVNVAMLPVWLLPLGAVTGMQMRVLKTTVHRPAGAVALWLNGGVVATYLPHHGAALGLNKAIAAAACPHAPQGQPNKAYYCAACAPQAAAAAMVLLTGKG